MVFGCIENENQVGTVMEIPADVKDSAFGYASRMKQVFQLMRIHTEDIKGAIISSVVPPITETMKEAVRLLIGIEPMVVGVGIKTGLHIQTDDPGTVASDLVATAVAAKEEYPLPCVIVAMGTAITVTCVSGEGKFIGGAILPGLEISVEALIRSSSLLPRIELIPPKKTIASSTAECIRSGVVYGTAGALDGVLERFEAELGEKPQSIVATGKIANTVIPFCKHSFHYDEKLLLKGLGYIYAKNAKVSL